MPWLGTFHSIGVKILRRHAELVGLKPDFTILDTDDQIRLLKQLLEAENIDEKRWPAASARRDHRRLEEPRPRRPTRCRRAKPRPSRTARGVELYAAYQARLKTLNAADFGDLLLEMLRLFREHPDVLRQYHERFRYMLVDEYQDTNVAQYLWLRLLGQGSTEHLLRRRRRPVDLWLARRRGRQHPALREGFSRRQGHPARAQLPLDRPYPRRRLASDRPQRGPARQDAAHRGRAGREGRGHRRLGLARRRRARSARRSSSCSAAAASAFARRDRDPGARLVPDARVRGPLHHPRPALPGDRRPALLRARRDPRRARLSAPGQPAGRRPRLRAHRQHAASAASATRRCRRCTHHARRQDVPLLQAARLLAETEELKAKPRARAARSRRGVRPLARAEATRCRTPSSPRSCSTSPATPRCGRRTARPTPPGRLENLKELVRSMEEFENLAGFLEHIALVMDTEKAEGTEAVVDHDPALRQGARIRHRVPARLGGRPVSAPALARRSGPRRPRGGAPPRLCRASRARGGGRRSISPRTGASTAHGPRASRRASSTNCPRRMSR